MRGPRRSARARRRSDPFFSFDCLLPLPPLSLSFCCLSETGQRFCCVCVHSLAVCSTVCVGVLKSAVSVRSGFGVSACACTQHCCVCSASLCCCCMPLTSDTLSCPSGSSYTTPTGATHIQHLLISHLDLNLSLSHPCLSLLAGLSRVTSASSPEASVLGVEHAILFNIFCWLLYRSWNT